MFIMMVCVGLVFGSKNMQFHIHLLILIQHKHSIQPRLTPTQIHRNLRIADKFNNIIDTVKKSKSADKHLQTVFIGMSLTLHEQNCCDLTQGRTTYITPYLSPGRRS